MVESGMPCTNCKLDGEVCEAAQNKRRLRKGGESERQSTTTLDADFNPPNSPLWPFVGATFSTDIFPQGASLETEADFGLTDNVELDPEAIAGDAFSRKENWLSLGSANTLPGLGEVCPRNSRGTKQSVEMPSGIHPIPLHIAEDDVAFLQRKGALNIPEEPLCDKLLEAYVHFVHPFLPVIDLDDFFGAIRGPDQTGTVSLMLFQAVMFAAITFVDVEYLRSYETRRAAQKSFFGKVKMLYDFDYETDQVVIVQSILLMTYWYESPNCPKDIWHWLGIAISAARSVGINCNPGESVVTRTRCLWKRIWWCCFMRDRLIAAGMRRPMRIKDEECQLSALEIDDFQDCGRFSNYEHILHGWCTTIDGPLETDLAHMCISLTKLCQIIGHILTIQYSTPDQKTGGTCGPTMKLLPRKSPAAAHDFAACVQELERWHEELPPAVHCSTNIRNVVQINDRVTYLHSRLLMGVYLGITSALHRPQLMLVKTDDSDGRNARAKIYQAAHGIADIFRDLFARDMIRLLPTTGVALSLPACIVLHADTQSPASPTREGSKNDLHLCISALRRLQEMHPSADFALFVLSQAVKRSGSPPSIASPHILPTASEASKLNQQFESPLDRVDDPGLTAGLLVFTSTLSEHEMQLLSGYTPTPAEESLQSVMTGTSVSHLANGEDGEQGSSVLPGPAMHAPLHESPAWWDFEDLINFGQTPTL
ncbi:hypothetical protein LTR92_004920 [Exophiala xenobiotica]|nr:hypothetical protein LTR92_004920 [Exophiala xenobiotica]